MNLFELSVLLTMNNKKFNEGVKEAEQKSEGLGSKIKNGLTSAAKAGAVALGTMTTAAVTGFVTIGKQALEAYANYEQLVGGVDTLFKQNSAAVQQYAANAYKTAGLSANAYMETVTSFSASLINSLNGNTAKAALVADTAITDMSDNANKMGTDITLIQNAYQGFAKQNYTMLDNLKLGYGGTKTEMERLLADASKISKVKYDISSFSDIAEAIHIIQTEMGITGTTSKEAATTIQGSISMMKSAWTNLTVGMADSNADIDTLITNFVDSVGTVAENVIPKVSVIGEGIVGIVEKIVPKIPPLIEEMLPDLIDSATVLISGLIKTLPPVIVNAAKLILDKVFTELPKLINAIFKNIGLDIDVTPLFSGIKEALSTIKKVFYDISQNQNALDFLKAVGIAIGVIVTAITAWNAVQAVLNVLLSANPIGLVIVAIGTLIAAVTAIITYWDEIKEVLSDVGQWIYDNVISPVVDFFVGLWESIKAIFSGVANWVNDKIISPVVNFFTSLWSKIVSTFHSIVDPLINIASSAATFVYDKIISPIGDFFVNLWNKVKTTVSEWGQIGKNLVEGLWNGIKDKATWLWEKIKEWTGALIDKVKDFFGIASPSKVFKKIGGFLSLGLAEGIEDESDSVLKSADTLANGLTSRFSGLDGSYDVTGTATVKREDSDTTIGLLNDIKEALNSGLYLDGDTLVGGIADRMNSKLGKLANKTARSGAY